MHVGVIDGRLGAIGPDGDFHEITGDFGPDPLRGALEADADLVRLGERALDSPGTDPPQHFSPPILRPSKIIGIGLNYRDHCREAGAEEPTSPIEFSKHPNSVVGAGDPVPLDARLSTEVDYEVELAIVIGRRCSNLREQDALDAVAGYTIANDVSARNLQFDEGQWVRAKSFDGFCPLGPVLVTPDELGDPQSLRLGTEVSGTALQDSSTSEMIFPVTRLLAHVSQRTTLEPGDVILTGTPWGTGAFREPPRYLTPGDIVSCWIEGIGTLTNPVVDAPQLVDPRSV